MHSRFVFLNKILHILLLKRYYTLLKRIPPQTMIQCAYNKVEIIHNNIILKVIILYRLGDNLQLMNSFYDLKF